MSPKMFESSKKMEKDLAKQSWLVFVRCHFCWGGDEKRDVQRLAWFLLKEFLCFFLKTSHLFFLTVSQKEQQKLRNEQNFTDLGPRQNLKEFL